MGVIELSHGEKKKKSKKGVDFWKKVRYNGGSLSKSTFSTSTKRNEKRGIFEVAYVASKPFFRTLQF